MTARNYSFNSTCTSSSHCCAAADASRLNSLLVDTVNILAVSILVLSLLVLRIMLPIG